MMKFISTFYALISLTRLINVIITFCSVIVAVLLCIPNLVISGNYLLAALAASSTVAAGNVINDVFDINEDSVNKPEKPLPSGKVSRTEAVYFYFILLLIAVVAAFSINWKVLSIVLLSNILLLSYSIVIKNIPLLGNLVISFLTGFVFIYGGIIAGNIRAAVIPAGFAFILNLSREVIKTIEDIPGDKKTGIITFPQKYGVIFSRKLISAFLILLLLLTFVPFINGIYGLEYIIIISVIVNPLLLYVIISLLETDQSLNLNKLSFILKLNMIFGLAAIYFGR
jgi:geranylgeranylglycerol-phosphate geranylgeranyltransferase